MNNSIDLPFNRRVIGNSFYLVIPTGDTDEAIRDLVRKSMRVEKAVDRLLDGELKLWDFLEIIEQEDLDMDQYCDEIEENLEQCLPKLIY